MNLQNKVVVVTGATGGVGRELVKKLDLFGAELILISKTESELQNLVKSLKGRKHKFYVCDFADQQKTIKVAQKINKDIEKIDILINGAGIGIYKPIDELTVDEWNKSLEIMVSAPFIFIKYLLENLMKSSDSLVLNIGSGAGVIPMAGRSAYCASKFALRGFTLSLSEEYKRIGNPKFCLITLGSTLTSFGPMNFGDKKEEMEKGKAYFTPNWVTQKLTEIIKDDKREIEYTLYPGEYGLGEWKKPEPI